MGGKGKKKRGQAAASLGIIGLMFGAGSTSGGLTQRFSTDARNNYSQSRTTQRNTQSRHVTGGTRDQGVRRRGSSQH